MTPLDLATLVPAMSLGALSLSTVLEVVCLMLSTRPGGKWIQQAGHHA